MPTASPAPAGPARHGPASRNPGGHACTADRGRLSGPRTAGPPATRAFPTCGRLRQTSAGPHVLVQALTHGNEVCGAIALDWLLGEGFRPTRGDADDVLRQRRRLPELRPVRSLRLALRRRGFQSPLDAEVLEGPTGDRRPGARPRLAPALRARRLPARSPFDDRPVPAARDGGNGSARASSSRRRWDPRSTSSSTAGTPPAGDCAITRSSTIPKTRATRC